MKKSVAVITPPTKRQLKIAQLKIERIKHYKKHRVAVGEQILRSALRAMATNDAALSVNSLLENKFKAEGVRLNITEVSTNTLTVLRAEIAMILAQHSTMSDDIKTKFIERVVARLVPTRDDVSTPLPNKREPVQRVEDLASAIEREMRRSDNGRKK